MSPLRPRFHKRGGSAGRDAAKAPSSPPAFLDLIKQQTWKRFGWPGMIVLFVVGGAVATWTNWSRWQEMPGVSPAVQWIKETVSPIRSSGRTFAVAVARLQGDPDRKEQRKLVTAVQDFSPGVEVLELRRTISLASGNQDEAVRAGHEEARHELFRSGADALLWGEVLASGQLRLHWTIGPLPLSFEPDAVEWPKRYEFTEKLNLPPLFSHDLSNVLGTIIVAKADHLAFSTSLSRFMASKGRHVPPPDYFADDLEEFLQRTEELLRSGRDRWKSAERADIALAYADGSLAYGELAGDNTALTKAVDAYREVLELRTRDEAPIDWAGTQVMLGVTLLMLGEREGGTERLEQATAAFSDGLQELTREKVPLKWAAAQLGFGFSLTALGEQEDGTARLEAAVAAYREALKEFTRETRPLQWAQTQYALGLTLGTWGERESGTARLEEAVVALREASQVVTREMNPLGWAAMQYNLGYALETLGEREQGTMRLEEAVAVFQDALQVMAHAQSPLTARTQRMLAFTLATLGERESSAARLEEAVTAYREALKGYSPEEAPLDWSETQSELAVTLGMLGRRESGTARLQEALMTAREALKALTREDAPLQWAEAQNTLGNVLTAIGEREGSTELIESAIKSLRVALTVMQAEGATDRVDRFSKDLDGAHRALEKLAVARKTRQ
jgi:tetratricopeptide (TPR) repeat protein